MKKFKEKDIDKWGKEFINRRYQQDTASVDGRKIDYFIMPIDLFQGIPNGLFRMTGDKKDGYLIGVSEEVPNIIKPYFVVSEHDEFMVYGLEDLGRTIHSEQNMIRILGQKEQLKKNYVNNKIILYQHMVEKSKDNLEQWGFTQEDYCGFQKALEFLKRVK